MKEQIRWTGIGLTVTVIVVGWMFWWALGPEIRGRVNQEAALRGRGPVFGEEWDHAPEPYTWSGVTFKPPAEVIVGYCKTKITESFSWSCKIVIERDEAKGLTDTLSSIEFQCMNYLGDIVYQGEFDEKSRYTFILQPPGGPGPTPQDVDLEDGVHEFEFSVTADDMRVRERHISDPIGDKAGATHAAENQGGDAWWVETSTSLSCVFGPVSDSSPSGWAGGEKGEAGLQLYFGDLTAHTTHWHNSTGYPVQITDIECAGVAIDAGELGPENWGGSAHLWVEGTGSTIRLYADEEVSYEHTWDGESANPPKHYEFGLNVCDMTGNFLPDLGVWCTGVRQLDAGSDDGPTLNTQTAWNAATYVQTTGIYSWQTDDPDLISPVRFYIDADSARAHGLEAVPEGSGSGVGSDIGFAHDQLIIIEGWLLDAEDRGAVAHVTEVASIAHEQSAGIYGAAHSHTDWTGTDATAPDALGRFTVSEDDGYIELELANSYIERLQTEVPAQTAPEGVPSAYIKRRHNVYEAEADEAVYCWLGWNYLYVVLDAPEATTVRARIEYYAQESHSDNHLSDSTRQTEYVFTPGATAVMTCESPVHAGAGEEVCFNLAFPHGDYEPLRVVKSIRLIFGTKGEWILAEPELALDRGDAQVSRGVPETHCDIKEFGAWGYRQGGMSAHVEGDYLEALAWPDADHANTLEPTAGHFSYVVGAASGIDLTGAWPLGTYMALIENCSDAWVTNYDGAAAAVVTIDDDDNLLKTLSCTDLREVNLAGVDSGRNLEVALRVREWWTKGAIKDTFVAEKLVEGQVHGRARRGTGPLRNKPDIGNGWRRELDSDDSWEDWQEVLPSDEHGHAHSDSGEVADYDGEAEVLYEYALGVRADEDHTSRLATREYAQVKVITGVDGPHMCVGVAGGVWMAYCNATGVAVVRRVDGNHPWEQMTPAFTAGTEQHPCICCMDAHEIFVCATIGGRTWIRKSGDWATTWARVEGDDVFLSDLANGTMVQMFGILFGVGYEDGKAYAEISDTGGKSKKTFAHGGTRTEIGLCDDAQPTIEVMPTMHIMVSLPRDGRMYTYNSGDFGETWTYLELLA